MENDLGNVGAQRRVVRYEQVRDFLRPDVEWVAVLDCGHDVKLADEPAGGVGRAPAGRYRDCATCTSLQRAEGA